SFVLRFIYRYFDDISRHAHGTFVPRLIEELTGSYMAGLLFVPVVLLVWRWPLDRADWRRSVPVLLLGLLAFSVVHTSLMWGTRSIIFPLIGHGAYDYGEMTSRYLMEFGEQTIGYTSTVGMLTAYRYYQRLRLRELHAEQLERSLAQSQLLNL